MAAAKARKAKIKRTTTETDISLDLNLDGTGKYSIDTGIPFFDHMLNLFAKHGLFDLKLKCKGDLEVDQHHTVEDIGIALGEALKKAIKDKTGLTRYGVAEVPLMDALSKVVLDISDRPYLVYNVKIKQKKLKDNEFDAELTREFMQALSNAGGLDLHVHLQYGFDKHHSLETIFKALGRALRVAVTKDKRIKGVMSTKGKL